MKNPSGGNAHDRAKSRTAAGKTAPDGPNIMQTSEPAHSPPRMPRENRLSLLVEFSGLVAVILGVALALEGTSVAPWLYPYAMALVYLGCAALLWGALNGHWHQYWAIRAFIALIVLMFGYQWTSRIVLAKVPLTVLEDRGWGDYPDGTDIGGIKWKKNWSDLRIYLVNPSDYDEKNIKLEISVDGMMQQIVQVSPVCQGFSAFPDAPPMFTSLTDPNTGKEESMPPSGSAISRNFRVVCDELPRKSNTDLIIPVISTDFGRDPSNPFPQQFLAPKRLPIWCIVRGEYQALGKTRSVDEKCESLKTKELP